MTFITFLKCLIIPCSEYQIYYVNQRHSVIAKNKCPKSSTELRSKSMAASDYGSTVCRFGYQIGTATRGHFYTRFWYLFFCESVGKDFCFHFFGTYLVPVLGFSIDT